MAGPRCPGAWCFRRCGSGAYTMRPYNEKGGRCVCRGGFHIRPYRPSIPATPRQTDQVIARRRGGLYGRPCRPPIFNAPPPNAVGTAINRACRLGLPAEPRRAACPHAAMAGPRCPGAWCFRRCGSGAYTMRPYNEKGGRCVCRGGFHIRPNRPAIRAAPPPNLVGRHVHLLPWQGCDDRRPGVIPGGAVRAANSRPYDGKWQCVHVGAAKVIG